MKRLAIIASSASTKTSIDSPHCSSREYIGRNRGLYVVDSHAKRDTHCSSSRGQTATQYVDRGFVHHVILRFNTHIAEERS
jgi:hypothetical protein